MIPSWLERSALISSLSVLVLAIFWPHIGPKFWPFFESYLLNPLRMTLFSWWIDQVKDSSVPSSENKLKFLQRSDHPKFTGRPLNRQTSEKETRSTAYSPFQGPGRSLLSKNPGMLSVSPGDSSMSPSSSHFINPLNGIRQQQTVSQSSMSLTVFTASIVALIVYAMMKAFSARFSGGNRESHEKYNYSNQRVFSNKTNDLETEDISYDKREWSKLSREERIRRLMLLHGGKNVSSAIKFLVSELEKQKRLLYEGLSETLPPCTCSCHTTTITSEYDDLSSPSSD